MNRMQGATLLKYRDHRYLKVASALVLLAMAAYSLSGKAGDEDFGGTLLGYLLGIAATLIVLILMLYGVVRRRIGGTMGRRQPAKDEKATRGEKPFRAGRLEGATLQGWLSAHIYLGVLLLVLATLHTGFHFGWNVHTLSYVLMLLLIASGLYGLYAYLNYPTLITLNMGDDTLDDLLLMIAELDELAAARALALPDEIQALVQKACRETRVGGKFWQQLSGEQRDCPTHYAVQQLPELSAKYGTHEQPKMIRELYALLLRKEKLLQRARTDVMLRARMRCWLLLHAPLGIALLAALTAHIVSVFFYW
ncbi:MAG: hypothetical protein Q7U37_02070 [Gallionella sp.]|nr:hypothetical protein [Gallionella sp.]